MSIAPAASLLSPAAISPLSALATKQSQTQTAIAQYGIKDEIKVSAAAIALLGGAPPAQK